MKIILLSDTHNKHKDLVYFYNNFKTLEEESADIIIHCGDFTNTGTPEETINFLNWYSSLNIQIKILIAGNHDWYPYMAFSHFKILCKERNITYLQDSSFTYKGINFYGTPWTPLFNNWAFMREEDKLKRYFSNIPENTNILITHGPSKFILDSFYDNKLKEYKCIGSYSLATSIRNIKYLKYHVFGHLHERGGEFLKQDGVTFYNVSSNDTNCYYIIDI